MILLIKGNTCGPETLASNVMPQLAIEKLQVCEFVCAGIKNQHYETHTLDIVIFVHDYRC